MVGITPSHKMARNRTVSQALHKIHGIAPEIIFCTITKNKEKENKTKNKRKTKKMKNNRKQTLYN